jgi:hypothetical protein
MRIIQKHFANNYIMWILSVVIKMLIEETWRKRVIVPARQAT